MELKVHNSGSGLQVSDAVFGKDFNESLVHQAVTAYMAGARAGTRGQKNRSAVRGGGAKPWRQKGTGRARAGTIRSPIWRKGGVTFAAQPRDFTQKLNLKMYRGAMCSILSELARQDRLQIVESFELDAPKTKLLATSLKALGMEDVLIVSDAVTDTLQLAARNMPFVEVATVSSLNAVSLLRHKNVIATTAAIKQIEEWLA